MNNQTRHKGSVKALGRPPVAVEAEWNPPRQFGDPDRSGLNGLGVEHDEVAAVLDAAINHRDHPSVAFRCADRTRHKDRLAWRIARGEP